MTRRRHASAKPREVRLRDGRDHLILRVREIPGAYIGAHCEVVNRLGVRVWPRDNRQWRSPTSHAGQILLGADRRSCEAFIAGYTFASERPT